MARSKYEARLRRKRRVRRTVSGSSERPRLSVFRSGRHIYAQVIDDQAQSTLVDASTMSKFVREELGGLNKTQQAEKVGQVLARRCVDRGIKKVVFDRGGYQYHGRVKALAAGAREGGLEF